MSINRHEASPELQFRYSHFEIIPDHARSITGVEEPQLGDHMKEAHVRRLSVAWDRRVLNGLLEPLNWLHRNQTDRRGKPRRNRNRISASVVCAKKYIDRRHQRLRSKWDHVGSLCFSDK